MPRALLMGLERKPAWPWARQPWFLQEEASHRPGKGEDLEGAASGGGAPTTSDPELLYPPGGRKAAWRPGVVFGAQTVLLCTLCCTRPACAPAARGPSRQSAACMQPEPSCLCVLLQYLVSCSRTAFVVVQLSCCACPAPGRLLWIFPADEDLSGLSGSDAAAVAAGVVAGAAAAAGRGAWRDATGWAGTPGPEEIELTEAGAATNGRGQGGSAGASGAAPAGGEQAQGYGVEDAAAWAAAPGAQPRAPSAGLEGLRHEAEAATARMAAKESAHKARGEGPPPGAAGAGSSEAERGAVDIEEAMGRVEAGEGAGGAAAKEGQQAGGAGGKAGGVPVVCEAERSSFERILLMPDMINDHIPDRYLQAIQQL